MFNMVQDFERPPELLVAAIRQMPTPILSDVMGRKGGMDAGIRPLDPRMRMGGPAFTVGAYPADNLMCHIALKLARPGDILVVNAGGYLGAALWGELTSLNAVKKGIGGLVIDGAVRDRLAICEIGFPVFARGCTPTGTFKVNLGTLNAPVACGQITVSPGDVVVGDADGVVVVPRGLLETILLGAREALAKEQTMRNEIAAGHATFELFGLKDVLMRLGVKLE